MLTHAENKGAIPLVFFCPLAVAIASSGIALHTASGDTTKYTLISDFNWG
jgi:hypothetical protein